MSKNTCHEFNKMNVRINSMEHNNVIQNEEYVKYKTKLIEH